MYLEKLSLCNLWNRFKLWFLFFGNKNVQVDYINKIIVVLAIITMLMCD